MPVSDTLTQARDNPVAAAGDALPAMREELLAWYDRQARAMPWRTPPQARRAGSLPDPYHVWLSEVMLQQTQVATVRAYFLDFIERWPSVEALALAPAEAVMQAWAGLGYYSRARNLKRCSEAVWFEHGGRFPRTSAQLQELPGIGAYTGAAIAAIAFDEQVAVVDGNVERVITRLHEIDIPVARAKPRIRELVAAMTPQARPGDFAQAMMDLGATICTPRKPACALCPLRPACGAARSGSQEAFPVRTAKAAKPVRKGAAFVARDGQGRVLLRRRAQSGLLGGMSEVPTTGWTARIDGATGAAAAPFAGQWTSKGAIRHTFTHFHLDLEVWLHEGPAPTPQGGRWIALCDLGNEALPTVMKKAIQSAIPHAFSLPGKKQPVKREPDQP